MRLRASPRTAKKKVPAGQGRALIALLGAGVAGSFSVTDILMADVLRLVDRFDGLARYPTCRDYVARATAFVKADADQMAHFAAAD
jgi:glutathione S-transferase